MTPVTRGLYCISLSYIQQNTTICTPPPYLEEHYAMAECFTDQHANKRVPRHKGSYATEAAIKYDFTPMMHFETCPVADILWNHYLVADIIESLCIQQMLMLVDDDVFQQLLRLFWFCRLP